MLLTSSPIRTNKDAFENKRNDVATNDSKEGRKEGLWKKTLL
jgi:hypothetical protein